MRLTDHRRAVLTIWAGALLPAIAGYIVIGRLVEVGFKRWLKVHTEREWVAALDLSDLFPRAAP